MLTALFSLFLLVAADDPREAELRRTAFEEHTAGRRISPDHGKAMVHYRKAHQAYVRWFGAYGNAETGEAYQMHYAYAELMYTLKDYGAAYDHYNHVVALDPSGRHSRFCAESAVFAAEEYLKTKPKAEEYGPDQASLVEACDTYVRMYPEDKKAQSIAYKGAYLLYGHMRLEDATPRLRAVVAMDPTTRIARDAANLTLDALIIEEKWGALRDTAAEFIGIAELGDRAFREDLVVVQTRAEARLR